MLDEVGNYGLFLEKKFDLRMINLSLTDIQTSCERSVEALEWDLYECDRRRVEFLTETSKTNSKMQSFLSECTSGALLTETQLGTARELLGGLQRAYFDDIAPRRKRALGRVCAAQGAEGWVLNWQGASDFAQSATDFYPALRKFPPIGQELRECPVLAGLIQSALVEIAHLRSNVFKAEIFVHHVQLHCTARGLGEGAPEGIHQDGADFIVPAFVVRRDNVSGFISQTYLAQDGVLVPLSTIELAVGEWVLQCDSNSPLFHDVSPGWRTRSSEVGIRETLGLDIHLR